VADLAGGGAKQDSWGGRATPWLWAWQHVEMNYTEMKQAVNNTNDIEEMNKLQLKKELLQSHGSCNVQLTAALEISSTFA
jgi:hypothetical protein